MIKKLISGGQTGADVSIVRVGQHLNIATGGIVPKGWMTEFGPNRTLKKFGFIEADTADYPSRTIRNIEDSDATLVFATDPESDGTRLTIDHAVATGKPHLLVDPFESSAVKKAKEWLEKTCPAVLNVAGNRESRSPGISQAAEQVLFAALGKVDDRLRPD